MTRGLRFGLCTDQNLSWEQSAAYPLTYVTAWRMLRRAGLSVGHDVLVVGAGSGVSVACIGIALAAGARVIATSRSHAKREAAKRKELAPFIERALARKKRRPALRDKAIPTIVALGGQQARQDSADGKTSNFGRGSEMQVPLEDPLKKAAR